MATPNNIRTVSGRDRLKIRIKPYWTNVGGNLSVGYRRNKTVDLWTARCFIEKGKYSYLPPFPADQVKGVKGADVFDKVQAIALQWVKTLRSDTTKPNPRKSGLYTLRDVVDDYYLKRLTNKTGKKSAKDARTKLEPHFMQDNDFADIPLLSLTNTDISACLANIVVVDKDGNDNERKSKSTANRTLNDLKAALNYAYHCDKIDSKRAWERVKPFRNVEGARMIILDKGQRGQLLKAADPDIRDLIQAGLYTGARKGEITRLVAADLDSPTSTIHIKEGKTKKRDSALSSTALAWFDSMAAQCPASSDLIFKKSDGNAWGDKDHYRPFAYAVTAANVQIIEHNKYCTDTSQLIAAIPTNTSYYTLRHTFISQALLDGMVPSAIAKTCGTSAAMIEKNYGKFFQKDIVAMLEGVHI